eukprot:scaffold187_cov266-Chaetoceros_neogracile.AAC.79
MGTGDRSDGPSIHELSEISCPRVTKSQMAPSSTANCALNRQPKNLRNQEPSIKLARLQYRSTILPIRIYYIQYHYYE